MVDSESGDVIVRRLKSSISDHPKKSWALILWGAEEIGETEQISNEPIRGFSLQLPSKITTMM